MTRPNQPPRDLEDDERPLHDLFASLRRHFVTVSERFAERLVQRLERASDAERRDPGIDRVVSGGLLELLDVISRLAGGSRPDSKPDSQSGGDDDVAR